MPFQYEGYRSPFANSIAELMLRRGDIAARQAEQSGNAWAGAAQNIGQAVAAIPQQIQQAKRADTIDQFDTLRLNEAKTGLAERDIFKKTLRDTPMITENGMKVYDIPTLTQNLNAGGVDPTVYVKPLQEINQTFRDFNASRLAVITQGAQKVKAAGDDPDLALHFIAGIEDNGVYSKEQIGQFRDLIKAGGQPAVAKLTSYLIGPQKGEVVPAGATVADPITHQPLFTAPPKPGDGQHVINGQLVGADGRPIGAPIPPQTPPKSLQSKSVLVDGKSVEAVFDPATGKLSVDGVDVTAKAKPIPAAAITIHNQNAQAPDLPTWALDDSRPTGPTANHFDAKTRMTPNGLYQAAVNYIANGQFPPTGRGSDPVAVAQRSAITSKVGAIAAASGMDEPALRAFYKANGASLAQQQKSLDAVQGFMATADKNADLLEKTLAKIPDTGVPAFNGSVRALSQKFAGNSNVSQFAIYLQSIQNEYARIISQPNLAGQLTDSARREAEALVKPDATVKQIVDSLQALRNEGTNRLVSIGDQIQRIQQRMTVGPGGAGAQGQQGNTQPIKVGGFTVVVK